VREAAAVGLDQRLNDLGVDPIADVRLALQRLHVLEAGAFRNDQRCIFIARVLVADVLDEQHEEHVVLVLGRLHATAQLVARGPEGGIQVGFLDGH
jgi:hypothetical protein